MTHENLLKVIGNNIKEVRNEMQMKGESLAKELGVIKAAVSQMENGLMDFRISLLHRIAEILNTDVSRLLPLKIIKSTEELENIPSHQEAILIHRMVIDQLISQMQAKKRQMNK